MLNIFGDFEVEGEDERYNEIECSKEMFENYWREVFHDAIVNKIPNKKGLLEINIRYKDESGYLEYYGDYAMISVDCIDKESHGHLFEGVLLFFNNETGLLETRKPKELTPEEEIKIKKKVEDFQKMFDKVFKD